jgi:hypothetical protein
MLFPGIVSAQTAHNVWSSWDDENRVPERRFTSVWVVLLTDISFNG